MAEITIPGMFLTGDHASRPAASAVGDGSIYSCSTHSLLYQSDGSSWTTWATLGGGAPAAHATSHEDGGSDEIDVTGLVGAGGGAGAAGLVPVVLMFGSQSKIDANDSTASYTRLMPVFIAGPMKLRAAVFSVATGNSGTVQWGLFDCSSDATACTKLAGGSGTLGSSGFQSIAASGAPVDIDPGAYIFIWQQPASNRPAINYTGNTTNIPLGKEHAAFTWDDTPDISTGWSSSYNIMQILLKGDVDGSGNQW